MLKSSNMNVDNLTNNGPDATSNPKTDGKNKVSDCIDAFYLYQNYQYHQLVVSLILITWAQIYTEESIREHI